MTSQIRLAYRLIFVSLALILAAVIFDFSLLFSFSAAVLFCLAMLSRADYDIRILARSALSETLQYKDLYITISLIGATVAVWLSSGTIPTMIYYGFNYIEGVNFLLFTFLCTGLCSFFMGTAVGTFSTIGLILYSIGTAIDIPAPILVGAIVSGAFISDKISPISGLVNITLNITETRYVDVFRSSMKTLIPALILTGTVYLLIGDQYIIYGASSELSSIQSELRAAFNIQPILFLFPIIILALSFSRIRSIYTIMVGVAVGCVFSFFVQGYGLSDILYFLLFGFRSEAELSFALSGGGIFNILEVVATVISAVFLVNLFIKSKMIDSILGEFARSIDSTGRLIRKTMLLSILITIVTCDQTIGLVLPASLFKEKYDAFSIKREVLFRTLSDSGVIVAPLFPWNINYLIISGVLGKSIFFSPYACLCFISPIISILFSILFYKKGKRTGAATSKA